MKNNKKQNKKLGTGLSQLLVKDEELASIIKRPGRPKKIKAGDIKKNLKKSKLHQEIYQPKYHCQYIELFQVNFNQGRILTFRR